MPVRHPKKSYVSSTGLFYSLKNKKSVMAESKLERDFFITLEFDKSVDSYEEQPLTLTYLKNNRSYNYTPDALVQYKSEYNKQPCIVEVKHSSELKKRKILLKEKFDQIEEYLINNDMDFKLFTEIDLDPPSLENMKFIYGYVSYNDDLLINEAKQLIEKEDTYKNILNRYSSDTYLQAKITPYIWKLVLLGHLEVDLSKKLSMDTLLKKVA